MNPYLVAITTACTLVTLNYIALKIRTRVEAYESIAVPIMTGIASIVMLLLPLPGGFMLDFAFAPIVMAGLRYGLLVSLLSTIAPAVYIILFHPDNIMLCLAQGLFIPAVVSALFHRSDYRSGYPILSMRDGLLISAILTAVRLGLGYAVSPPESIPDWLWTNAAMLVTGAGALTVLIAMFNDDSHTWLVQRQLEMQANQDGLTRLPNLRSFLEIAQSTLLKQPIAILMIDIDNFKQFNDRNGHLMGDQLLREIGQLLRNLIRDQDYVARYGGEEFIVMCLTTDIRQLRQIANRLCSTVATHHFEGDIQPDTAAISISIGISTCERTDDHLQQVIAEADEALYESKRTGKNKYTFFDKDNRLTATP
jgi:diguanylate cyclase